MMAQPVPFSNRRLHHLIASPLLSVSIIYVRLTSLPPASAPGEAPCNVPYAAMLRFRKATEPDMDAATQ